MTQQSYLLVAICGICILNQCLQFWKIFWLWFWRKNWKYLFSRGIRSIFSTKAFSDDRAEQLWGREWILNKQLECLCSTSTVYVQLTRPIAEVIWSRSNSLPTLVSPRDQGLYHWRKILNQSGRVQVFDCTGLTKSGNSCFHARCVLHGLSAFIVHKSNYCQKTKKTTRLELWLYSFYSCDYWGEAANLKDICTFSYFDTKAIFICSTQMR